MLGRHLGRRTICILSGATAAGFLAAVGLGELAASQVMKVDPPGGFAEADARAKAALLDDHPASGRSDDMIVALPLPTVTLPFQLSLRSASTDYPAKPVGRAPRRSETGERGSAIDALSNPAFPFLPDDTAARAADPITHGDFAALAPDGTAAVGPEAPAEAATERADDALERSVVIAPGDTLSDILLRQGVAAPVAHDAVEAMRNVLDLRTLKPGLALKLTFDGAAEGQGRLLEVSLPVSPEQTLKVARSGNDEFRASRIAMPLMRRLVRSEGVIRSSLYEDAVAAGVPIALLTELIRAFSYDVDFQREIQPGDRFEVAYEQYTDADGRTAKTGNIAYAALTLSGSTLKLYRFRPQRGFADYFNAKGESVRKALLRTPMDGARISSGYGMRLHPILGYTTMHKGVDFAAPTGTPIMAAGDGTVELAGRRGNYGIYLRVRHNRDYSTAYAHMNAIARGVRVGSHVHQGQVIGYVGATGLATGPHLYYEVLVHDRQINPLSVKLPTGVKLAGAELRAFLASKAATDTALASLPQAGKMAKKGF